MLILLSDEQKVVLFESYGEDGFQGMSAVVDKTARAQLKNVVEWLKEHRDCKDTGPTYFALTHQNWQALLEEAGIE